MGSIVGAGSSEPLGDGASTTGALDVVGVGTLGVTLTAGGVATASVEAGGTPLLGGVLTDVDGAVTTELGAVIELADGSPDGTRSAGDDTLGALAPGERVLAALTDGFASDVSSADAHA